MSSEPAPDQPAPRRPKVLVMLFIAMLGFTALLAFLSFPAGLYAVFVGSLSHQFNFATPNLPFLWVGPIFLPLPIKADVGGSFAFFTVVYVAMLAYSLTQKVRFPKAASAASREGFASLFSSPFAVVIVSIGFLTFSGSLVDSLISTSGVPIGNVQGDPLGLLLSFTESPLAEEFGFRVMLIGVVALILSMGRPAREALRSLWRPSAAFEGLAVGSGTSVIIWAATGFSAVTFGACHVYCGSTWDIGKFPEAAYGGVVLGFLYVKYGFHVAVLAHWGVDYLGSVFAFLGQAAYGIPWNSNTNEFIGQYVVDIDMLLVFGLASFLVVVYLGLRRYTTKAAMEPVPPLEALKTGP